MKKVIKHLDEIRREDYQSLFDGKIKYITVLHEKIGCGQKPSWIKVFLWNLAHSHNKRSYDYPHYYSNYVIYVSVYGKGFDIRLKWNKKDMVSFIKENSLQEGDRLTVYFLAPSSRGGHWCAGGHTYLITKEGWEKIDDIRGE